MSDTDKLIEALKDVLPFAHGYLSEYGSQDDMQLYKAALELLRQKIDPGREKEDFEDWLVNLRFWGDEEENPREFTEDEKRALGNVLARRRAIADVVTNNIPFLQELKARGDAV